ICFRWISSPPTMGIGTSSRSRGRPRRPHANGLRINRDASELGRSSLVNSHRARSDAYADPPMHVIYWEIFDTAELTAVGIQPGQRLVTAVQARIDSFAEKYCKLYPAAVRCLLSDCEQLT